ncbi:tetratricopeptide repeat protein [Rhizohabitans arisaemae]|uniref:tetratricopeptide repeat protein n=1 Tax=Rhizohabitans arisaemae TaxID=2720610 RepID=UPI0024B2019D|nr:tetratricopeptide repeat protein [Rhizohabitans arisaemae]
MTGVGGDGIHLEVSGSAVLRDLIQIGNVARDVIINQAGPQPEPERIVEGDIPAQPPGFQPREDLLRRLHDQVAAGGAAVICALTGTPGVGKTTLAASYAWACRHAEWPLVAWIAAENENQIVAGLGSLAHRLGIRLPDDDAHTAATKARNRLAGMDTPSLLVFDNAADPDVIRRWCPSTGAVRVIVTSRNAAFGRLHPPVPVEEFTDEQALRFLRERTGLSDDAGARRLAAELGRLPLALSQAASVIARRGIGYPEYLELLAGFPLPEHLSRHDGDAYPDGTAQAILLSVGQLEPDDEDTHEVLDLLSVLSPAGIPRALFHEVIDDPAGRATLGETLARLADASLITFTENGGTILMHRLVQRVLRERALLGHDPAEAVRGATGLLTVFAELIPDGAKTWGARVAVDTVLEQCDALYPVAKAAGLLSDELMLLRLWGVSALLGLAAPDRAVPLAQATLNDFEDILEHGHPDALRARALLAFAYQDLGRPAEAISLLHVVLTARERIDGPDHPDTLTTRYNLALAYQDVGRFTQAIDLHHVVLTARERILGSDDPDTLTSRDNLARAYQQAGRPTEAVALHQAVLADRERVLGPDHPQTLGTSNNLAFAHQHAGHLSQAVTLFEKTLADLERVLGPDHPDTLNCRNNLALAYTAEGRHDQAFELYRVTLADRARLLGPHHPDTLLSRNNLAVAYRKAGQVPQAIALYEEILADCERVLSPDHPMTHTVRENLEFARRSAQESGPGWLRAIRRIIGG